VWQSGSAWIIPTIAASTRRSAATCGCAAASAVAAVTNIRKSARLVLASEVNAGVGTSPLRPLAAISRRIPSSAPRRSCADVGRCTDLSDRKL
jgi:hypothetical protein